MTLTVNLQLLALPFLAAAPPALGDAPNTKVSLHPAVGAVTPGATFEVAIQFELADGWHIYWKNAGDSGMPPRVEWQLPQGFKAGALRFPAPRRRLDPGNLTTNVLEGTPVLLQSITAPATLEPGGKVTLKADVQWLACKKACVRERASVSVELPVGGLAAELDPRHQGVVQRARRALPIRPDQSKHVRVSASAAVQVVRPGQSFEVVLNLAIAAGSHVQSNQPPIAAFIPTHVFVERDRSLDVGKVVYPPPQEHRHPQLGKVSEYRGNVRIRIPVEVRADAAADRVRVAGVLTSQACNDKTGTCFPPEHITWGIELPVDRPGTLAATVGEEPVGDSDAGPPASAQARRPGEAVEGFFARLGLPGLLLACFLYGLVINATPCVLPLLSIKVIGFVQQAHESRRRTALLGLTFGAGVMLFFVILGLLAVAGKNVLQFPAAVIALGAVVTALALSMLGVYTLGVPTAATKLDAAIQKEGPLASFGKGALAPVLGFACTAPLLGYAFAWATQQPPGIAVIAFLFAGLGMASPYVLLGANPNWLGFLPKPGPWMLTFERIMGFLLLGMVVLLVHPLVTQIGVQGLEWTLAFLVAIATACWVLGRIDLNMPTGQRWRYRSGAAAIVLGAGVLIYGLIYPLSEAQGKLAYAGGDDWSKGIPWKPWSVRETVRSGKTVFLDFTSAYCTQCKANKLVATDTAEVRARMQELGVVPLQGDYTSADPEIAALLKKYQRPGAPLNLIFPAGKPDQPIVLRTILTKEYLLEKLDQAGPSLEVAPPKS